MPGETKRYRAIALVVLGIIALVVSAYLVIGLVLGDDTDEVDPQNNEDDAGSTPALVLRSVV